MPIVDISGLSVNISQDLFRVMGLAMKRAIASIEELGITPDQVTVRFHKDMCEIYDVTEILVDVTKLFVKKGRTTKVKNKVAEIVSKMMYSYFPTAKVEGFVSSFDQRKEGFHCIERKVL